MKLEIWFEFASTYSYLTVSRAEPLFKAANIDFSWRPFLLGPIFKAQGLDNSPFVLNPTKGEYMWRDMERLCEKYELPFIRPAVFPANGLKAARVMTAATNEPWSGSFARAVFAANFGKGADISQEEVLADALESCDVPAAYWLDKAQQTETKTQLRHATDEARDAGIFGAPTFRVGNEIFWGNDRLQDAISYASSKPSTDQDIS